VRRLAASALLCLACCVAGPSAGASELPIFDAHLHYSQDAWKSVPPPEAIAILRKAGLGEFRLYGADADLPRDVAERIAWKNGETLFGGFAAQ